MTAHANRLVTLGAVAAAAAGIFAVTPAHADCPCDKNGNPIKIVAGNGNGNNGGNGGNGDNGNNGGNGGNGDNGNNGGNGGNGDNGNNGGNGGNSGTGIAKAGSTATSTGVGTGTGIGTGGTANGGAVSNSGSPVTFKSNNLSTYGVQLPGVKGGETAPIINNVPCQTTDEETGRAGGISLYVAGIYGSGKGHGHSAPDLACMNMQLNANILTAKITMQGNVASAAVSSGSALTTCEQRAFDQVKVMDGTGSDLATLMASCHAPVSTYHAPRALTPKKPKVVAPKCVMICKKVD